MEVTAMKRDIQIEVLRFFDGDEHQFSICRAWLPGGWILFDRAGNVIDQIADPDHVWLAEPAAEEEQEESHEEAEGEEAADNEAEIERLHKALEAAEAEKQAAVAMRASRYYRMTDRPTRRRIHRVAVAELLDLTAEELIAWAKTARGVNDSTAQAFEHLAEFEAERVAAEQAERERQEAERVAAEQAERERQEAERVAAEQAERERQEAERVAAEQAERERQEAERVAAEERIKRSRETASFVRDEAKRIKDDPLFAKLAKQMRRAILSGTAKNLHGGMSADQLDSWAEETNTNNEAAKAELAKLAEAEEKARIEAERKAAEEKAERERIEAERVAAEEKARIEAEAKAEADRKAAEDAIAEDARVAMATLEADLQAQEERRHAAALREARQRADNVQAWAAGMTATRYFPGLCEQARKAIVETASCQLDAMGTQELNTWAEEATAVLTAATEEARRISAPAPPEPPATTPPPDKGPTTNRGLPRLTARMLQGQLEERQKAGGATAQQVATQPPVGPLKPAPGAAPIPDHGAEGGGTSYGMQRPGVAPPSVGPPPLPAAAKRARPVVVQVRPPQPPPRPAPPRTSGDVDDGASLADLVAMGRNKAPDPKSMPAVLDPAQSKRPEPPRPAPPAKAPAHGPAQAAPEKQPAQPKEGARGVCINPNGTTPAAEPRYGIRRGPAKATPGPPPLTPGPDSDAQKADYLTGNREAAAQRTREAAAHDERVAAQERERRRGGGK